MEKRRGPWSSNKMALRLPTRRLLNIIILASTLGLGIVFLLHQYESLRPDISKISLPGAAKPAGPKTPKYKPKPQYTPPPIKDNFALLANSPPPPIPKWNQAPKNMHKSFRLPVEPPLLIGFTRSWPILLQAVTSYITAGWPADQIYVVENTGVQQANTRGQLTLQNPFYLNHTTLKTLGVNIVQTPTLLSFAQMQNFFLALSYEKEWPYYFWSHMDVLALSYEDGQGDLTPKATEEGYKSLYALALKALQEARDNDDHWGVRFFAYDHLALVNPVAFEAVGGWDTLIPYYITDCDMHSRLIMSNWTMRDARAGFIMDVNTAMDDLAALYRVDGVAPSFSDPNPPPPEKEKRKRSESDHQLSRRTNDTPTEDDLERWRKLLHNGEAMSRYKHDSKRGRNTWQTGQRGGEGEPFYYPADGLVEGIDRATEMGKEVFARKWGHRGCDLIEGAGLKFKDQWLVEKDF